MGADTRYRLDVRDFRNFLLELKKKEIEQAYSPVQVDCRALMDGKPGTNLVSSGTSLVLNLNRQVYTSMTMIY